MEINLRTVGRNTISYIKPENVITIHGKNGVGKSMAATLLEIASGNYIFENEDRFLKLSKIIKDCEINFKISKSENYKVKLQPYLWKFDKSFNRINPITIGTYFHNDKEIDFPIFNENIFIRTIRGDESLQQQILFFKEVFLGKIQRKINQIEKKLEYLTNYEIWFRNIAREEKIKEYSEEQGIWNDLLNDISNLDTTISNRESSLRILKEKFTIIEKLSFLKDNNKEKIEKSINIDKEKLRSLKKSLNDNSKQITQISLKLEPLTRDYDEDTKKILTNLRNLNRKKINLKEILETQYHIEIKDIGSKKTNFEREIKKIEEEIKGYKKKIEDLNEENKKVVTINNFLIKLRDTLEQAISNEYAEDKIIKLNSIGKKDLKLSFKDLYKIIKQNNVEFSQNEILQRYKDMVESLNNKIRQNRPILENLSNYSSISQKIRDLKNKSRGSKSKLDKYIDLENQIEELNIKHKELMILNQDIEKQIDKLKIKTNSEEELLTQINSLDSQRKFIMELKKLDKTFSDFSMEKLLEYKTKIDEDQQKMSSKLHHYKEKKSEIQKKIEISKKKISKLNEGILDTVKKLELKDLPEAIKYITLHSTKLQKYLHNSTEIQKRLKILKEDIIKIIDGRKPKNPKNLELVTSHFDSLFKKIYGKKEFFKYVFMDYSTIGKFDIAKKNIVFITHSGMEEVRDLEEFSSGEKTYAYCRAIISMAAHMARYNIVILDESYALLDHEHSQNLYQFQIKMVKSNGISKFINILPLKEDLVSYYNNLQSTISREQKYGNKQVVESLQNKLEIVKEFNEEVISKGYYQEILYPNKKTIRRIILDDMSGYNNISESQSKSEALSYSFVLDGSNISRNNQNSKFAKISDVLKCKKALQDLDVPEENIIILFGAGIRHNIADIETSTFNTLLKQKNVNQAPKGKDDDSFIIQYAMKHNSYIISNDYYKEYKKKSQKHKNFLETHSIRYTIIRNDLLFEENFDERIKEIMAGK